MRRRVRPQAKSSSASSLPVTIAGAGHGADRGAGDDVGLEAGVDQALQHADMGPAAGRAAAKRDANLGLAMLLIMSRPHAGWDPAARRPQATIRSGSTGVAECDESSRRITLLRTL